MTEESEPNQDARAGAPVPPWGLRALAGLVSAGVALAVAALAAALLDAPSSSPVVAVGGVAVDSTPVWLKDFAIRQFGTHDKLVLVSGIVVVLAVYAAVVGIIAFRKPVVGAVGVGFFAVLGMAAALTRPTADAAAALPSLLGGAAGVITILWLVRASRPRAVASESADATAPTSGGARGWDRRGLLLAGMGAVALAAVGGLLSRVVGRGGDVTASRAAVRLPSPADPALKTSAGQELGVQGITPFTTANNDFYRVDTALVLPSLTAEEWTLKVHGMVDRELELSYADLIRRPLVERDVTLTCVSNEVGGPYAGTARWLGYPLRELLEEVGVQPGAQQLVSRSVDGWTAGTPVSVAIDGRDALLVVGMNGEPLPQAHGFPVRMVIPGLYGYVSATKWLVDLELTTYDAYDAYWTARGWATDGPIKTMARIDTPRPLATLKGSSVAVGGVAWAQHRGIERVEVRVDGGPWHEARLGDVPSTDTWRQWAWVWDPDPGRHTLEARAVDGSGTPQTGERAKPFPDGASGWHSVVVTAA